jgi:hypothetical protein
MKEQPLLMDQQKIAIVLKALYMFNPYQNSNDILHWDRKVNLKVHMEAQNTLKNQSNPEPKSNPGGITIPDFKL